MVGPMGRLACAVAFAVVCFAEQNATVWDGAYTAAQAERGKAIYAAHCSRCHGDDPARSASPLAGERFMDHWEAHTLEQLFRRIRDSMPPEGIGTVSDADKRDAMAYVLQQNGFPAGREELAPEDRLTAVEITRKTGPGALKTGAIVRVAGCLAQRSDPEWELTAASEPERTTLEARPPARRPPVTAGSQSVRLLNVFPNPGAHVGHTMEAIGFLVRDGAGDTVNVVSLTMLAPACER